MQKNTTKGPLAGIKPAILVGFTSSCVYKDSLLKPEVPIVSIQFDKIVWCHLTYLTYQK
jgi:hypothetical protein